MRHALPVLLVPLLAAGFLATLLPAFGHLPAIGAEGYSLAPWRALIAFPGFGSSLALTLRTGLLASAFAVMTAFAIARHPRARPFAPLLALPHAPAAIGLAFLIAPSGWIARLLGQWVAPPDIITVGDRFGWAVILGLWLKETPYLLLCMQAALSRIDPVPKLRAAASLGMTPAQAWPRVILPLLWPQIRLPLAAVLAYALTAVDMPLILGPDTPPTLAVQALRWLTDPDLARWPLGCAAAVLLGVIALTPAILLYAAIPTRLPRLPDLNPVLGGFAVAILACLVMWSLADVWRFPAPLPDAWTLRTWQTHFPGSQALATLGLGVAATGLALVFAIAHLAANGRAGQGLDALLFAPLILPQLGFLFGLQSLLLRTPLANTPAAVLLVHLLFVLPYVVFALAGPWRALSPHHAMGAASLGAGRLTTLRRITLPLLRRPLQAAAATGFAVSCTLYLPTLFAGGGRIATLATESMALASGADRRITAVVALTQALLPLLAFSFAGCGFQPALRRPPRAPETGTSTAAPP